jgi:DNA-binding NtrC family response regulator
MPAASPVRVLVLEDDEALSEILCDELRDNGYETIAATTVAAARLRLSEREFDVALLDLILPDGKGIEILKKISDEDLPTECIVLTGYAEVASAIAAMKLGAYDYLTKPAQMEELEVVVQRAAEKARLRGENAALQLRVKRQEPLHGLITEDPGMRRLLEMLDRTTDSELPILIQGESGTGKELIARAVHERSPRSGHPFVAVNCAAVPENIIESELFGHERGAFTGAVDRKPGLFEVARQGVLFLDEIGDVSPAVQVRLLRVLESKEFFRVGGTRIIQTDVRVVSATNKDLQVEIEAERFREDLFFRLNGVTLSLPALRDRPGDVALLARHFLDLAGSGKMLSAKAVEALERYSWPGNVRELQMVVQRAILLSAKQTLEPEDLPLQAPRRRHRMRTDLTLAELELEYIRSVLDRFGGHRAKAARALGIDPKTLYNKLGPDDGPKQKDRASED